MAMFPRANRTPNAGDVACGWKAGRDFRHARTMSSSDGQNDFVSPGLSPFARGKVKDICAFQLT
ncbi:hypothetical protein RHECIAT_CH0003940 [Rhizobium etli CIAT 652]|uniref:Uncharacterized protein n=1 Tax=Rhizobium etli (strain CIAT 652) TaxID=491916 RepID=B3Q0T6_RHIE6|nr:hypothetical protein RHECIAT_CH0003940 [Rhizobium etli CIAT 652]KKZ88377.1 hypothetical protein RPHASCH2410_CH04290 [Rhizobium phaseoli Ch24-10]